MTMALRTAIMDRTRRNVPVLDVPTSFALKALRYGGISADRPTTDTVRTSLEKPIRTEQSCVLPEAYGDEMHALKQEQGLTSLPVRQ